MEVEELTIKDLECVCYPHETEYCNNRGYGTYGIELSVVSDLMEKVTDGGWNPSVI